jgi:MFS family permease
MVTASGAAARGGAFASLRNPNYRRYFAAQLCSLIGGWMQGIALPWLVYEQTRTGATLGVIIAVQSAPVLLLAPYGGVVVDRMNTRRLLVITQALQGAMALIRGLLTLAGALRIWVIVPLALGSGLAQAFDNPARQSFVMELVGPEDLRNAISLNSVTINIARAVGPAIAAGVIATVGVGDCFLANAASFGAVMFVLATLIMMALIGTLSYNYPVTLLLLAKQAFHGGATTYSALTIALGSGAVLSGLVVAARAKTGHPSRGSSARNLATVGSRGRRAGGVGGDRSLRRGLPAVLSAVSADHSSLSEVLNHRKAGTRCLTRTCSPPTADPRSRHWSTCLARSPGRARSWSGSVRPG